MPGVAVCLIFLNIKGNLAWLLKILCLLLRKGVQFLLKLIPTETN